MWVGFSLETAASSESGGDTIVAPEVGASSELDPGLFDVMS